MVLKAALFGVLLFAGQFIYVNPPGATVCPFYVDPDVSSGAHAGTAAEPWQSLSDSGAWAAVNASLAACDTTVYFSARAASSDVNQTTTTSITQARTDTSSHRLTLDGESKYNTSDSSPVWAAYPTRTQSVTHALSGRTFTGYAYGGSRFEITAANPYLTSSTRQDTVTVKGFSFIATGNQCLVYWDGNNVTITRNECTATAAATAGPGFYFVGTREEAHSNPCVADNAQNCRGFQNLTVSNNFVHDERGEGMYFGGCADWSTGCGAMSGYTISGNLVINPAYRAGEGDGIDIKTAIGGLVVRDNAIIFTTTYSDPRSCLETLSGGVFDGNVCDAGSVTRLGFSLTDFWNNDTVTRVGTIVRNNIVFNLSSGRGGIYCWGDTSGADDFTAMKIDNNTVADSPDTGIYLGADCTAASVQNNLVASAGVGLQAPGSSVTTHTHNQFYRTSGNLVIYGATAYTSADLTTFEATALSSAPVFASTATPLTAASYQLQSGAPGVDSGVTLTGFAASFGAIARPTGSAWDRGAWER